LRAPHFRSLIAEVWVAASLNPPPISSLAKVDLAAEIEGIAVAFRISTFRISTYSDLNLFASQQGPIAEQNAPEHQR
jgi:hypothetical protein